MPTEFQCELISWNRVVELALKLAGKIREQDFKPDIIIAIGRGGYVPARLLADYLDLMDLTDIKIEHYHAAEQVSSAMVKYGLNTDVSHKNVLVVDDVSDSGDTFNVAVEHIRHKANLVTIRTAVLHHKISSRFIPDFYAVKVIKWRWLIYPWAQFEDISSFIAKLKPRPNNRDEVINRLQQDYGIKVPNKLLDFLCDAQVI